MSDLNCDKKFDLDLEYGKIFERELQDILYGRCPIEVKTEKNIWAATGNVFIEYNYNGKPSGIFATESKYYAICLASEDVNASHSFFVINTKQLKEWLLEEHHKGTIKTKLGGDNSSSSGFIVPIKRLHEIYFKGQK